MPNCSTIARLLLVSAVVFVTAGCAGGPAHTRAAGGIAGAGLGALTGAALTGRPEGALIGGVIGAFAGTAAGETIARDQQGDCGRCPSATACQKPCGPVCQPSCPPAPDAYYDEAGEPVCEPEPCGPPRRRVVYVRRRCCPPPVVIIPTVGFGYGYGYGCR